MAPRVNKGRAGSALHNFGHSFVSLMNFGETDYVMSKLAAMARATGRWSFTFDILDPDAPGDPDWGPEVQDSVRLYRSWFPKLLKSHGVPIDNLRRAVLCITFDFDRLEPCRRVPGRFIVPFVCLVTAQDRRGRVHVGRVEDAWLLT